MLKSWHRTAGLLAAIFLLALTVSGLLLMHTDRLGLDDRHVRNERILDWYGIRPAPPPYSVAAGAHWLSQLGQHVYFDDVHLVTANAALAGAVAAGPYIVAALGDVLLVLDDDGGIIDRVDAVGGLPADVRHVGLDRDGRVVVQAADARYVYDPAAGTFTTTDTGARVEWSESTELPHDLAQALARAYRGNGVTLERFLLDVHSGRLLGTPGVVLINAAAVLTLILIVSGAILWAGRKRGDDATRASNDRS